MKKTLHLANLEVMIHTFRFQLLLKLQEMGYEVHVAGALTNPDLVKDFEEEGIVFHEIPIARGLNPSNALRCIRMVKKLIEIEKYDIVHTNTPTGGMVGRMGAFLAGHKKIYHTTAGFYFHENMNKQKYWFFSTIEKYLTRKTSILFSPNKEDMETCKRLGIKPINEIVYCGPSGVKIERYPEKLKENYRKQLCEELNIPENSFIVGSVGRLVWEKGYKEFIDVIALLQKKYDNIVAACIGRGPQKDEIIAYAKQKGVTSLNFIGFTREVPRYLMAYDVLLFPSYREGFPIATLEAMASKTPVVAFDIRGCRESIIPGETGYIVPFQDVDSMFDKVKKLKENSELRSIMGVNGRERVMNHFLKSHHVEKQISYY